MTGHSLPTSVYCCQLPMDTSVTCNRGWSVWFTVGLHTVLLSLAHEMNHFTNLKTVHSIPLSFPLLPLPSHSCPSHSPPPPVPFLSSPPISLVPLPSPSSMATEIIQTLPSQLGVDDVEDFCALARYFSSQTPQSFRKVWTANTVATPQTPCRRHAGHADQTSVDLVSWETLWMSSLDMRSV